MKARIRWIAMLSLVVVPLASGCAKKATQAPPTPPPAPPQESSPPTPPPAPPAAEQPPAPVKAEFMPVYFDLDSSTLREDARAALDQNARMLRDDANGRVTIEGHCDERGTSEYNQALGEKRAQAARDYLVSAGIDGSRIQIISYGKERPFSDGHDEGSWQQNRRAHFVAR